MSDLTETIDLNTSIARLQDFIDTYPDGEQIDGDMPLTVDDVRRVIEAARRGASVVPIRKLDLSKPLPDDLTP
ncbi:hypothetical protein ACFQ15_05675 [Sphingomonas hankookensis]|uniref:hypothetical protein n=1 Tax=Sphingomonas hankookensis TaxID=563996 RepID=UPI001F5A6652|nr:hypothetical protein [Sphingomonas hankookensis]